MTRRWASKGGGDEGGRGRIGCHRNPAHVAHTQERAHIRLVRVGEQGVPEEEQKIDAPLGDTAPHLLVAAHRPRHEAGDLKPRRVCNPLSGVPGRKQLVTHKMVPTLRDKGHKCFLLGIVGDEADPHVSHAPSLHSPICGTPAPFLPILRSVIAVSKLPCEEMELLPLTLPLHRRQIAASPLVLGCMGLGGDWKAESPIEPQHTAQALHAVETALEVGINFFDHADIYRSGKAEEVFGQVLRGRPSLRERVYLQTKCGIRFAEGPGVPGRYDFSKEHIVESVDGSLRRLGTEYLDILLLHRPDPLMEPEEVAQAFDTLHAAGKVRAFGVSNMNAAQMQFLQASLDQPITVNQIELNLAHLGFLESGVHVNQAPSVHDAFPPGLFEYCQMNGVQIQSWSPLARGLFSGPGLEKATPAVQSTAALASALARDKGTTQEAILLAWILRHPAGIQPVIGTTRAERIRACAQATQITLTREEWYALYVTARGRALP